MRQREGDVSKGIPLSAKIGRVCIEEAAQDLTMDYTVNRRRTLADLTRRLNDRSRPVLPRASAREPHRGGCAGVCGAPAARGRRQRYDQSRARAISSGCTARHARGEGPAAARISPS